MKPLTHCNANFNCDKMTHGNENKQNLTAPTASSQHNMKPTKLQPLWKSPTDDDKEDSEKMHYATAS
jgi:hypothetical protein